MERTNTIIIGAGQTGLAMSDALTQRSIDHIILERGQVANSWRKERWDSLRLLSPNWANKLPGCDYAGDSPDGFMPVAELIDAFDHCADRINAPVKTETTVVSVKATATEYTVQTDQGALQSNCVIMANGACATPAIPDFASELPNSIHQFSPQTYKRPDDLPAGPVLVVGASASGLQLAQEIQLAGRQVILAVGNHLRLPRTYRGLDTFMWLEAMGTTSIPYTDVDDIERVRRTPSLSLVAGKMIDLNGLQALGVEITGRLACVRDGTAWFSGSLANIGAAADLKLNRFLDKIDKWVSDHHLDWTVLPPERFAATQLPHAPRLKLNLHAERVGSVIWATGFRPDFSWLKLPVFDRKGRLAHDGGVVAEGLYAMGLPYLRQRKSTFINGAAEDARFIAEHYSAELNHQLAA